MNIIGTASVLSSDPLGKEWMPDKQHYPLNIENRIYREEFTGKKCKTAICWTVSILQVYFTYLGYINCWALEYHYIENLKLLLKENQIMK